jgi:phosphomevalonate kinase
MSGEHDTPIGTPVVIAPGKVFLVGEYAVLDDGCAVLAAITRHARAQFIPRMDAMPPMVSELVRRTKTELGEAAAALPPGAVLVNTDDFQLGCAAGGLGSSAAIAVATVGAVYESLGLAVEERRAQISALADSGRRAIQGDVGSGADTAAATYGGLIQITRHKDTLPSIERLAPPVGLHLVLFSAGGSISTRQMTTGLREYARHEPAAFEHAMANLREIAHRFVAEVAARRATGAVVAAGKYGEELAKLAAAASVPILTETFAQASELAREFGGIAKPAGAGGGEIGVAMFATPEAAKLFRNACTQPLAPLEGDIEPLGVRCLSQETSADEFADQDTKVAGPLTDLFEIEDEPVREVALIIRRAEDITTVPEREAEKPDLEYGAAPPAHPLRRWIVVAAAIILVALVIWFTFPKPIEVLDTGTPTGTPSPPSAGESATSPLLPLPEGAAPSAESAGTPQDTSELPTKDSPQPSHGAPGRSPHGRATSANHKADAHRTAHVAPARTPSTASSARRAGSLSADDF